MKTYIIYLSLCMTDCSIMPTPYTITAPTAERAHISALLQASGDCPTAGYEDTDDTEDADEGAITWIACGRAYRVAKTIVIHK
jgi:hypothetical protein